MNSPNVVHTKTRPALRSFSCFTTNLTYLPPELYEKPYFVKADMSKFIALIIDSLNHDVPISSVISPTDKIHALLEKREKGLL